MIEGLTTINSTRKAELFEWLLKMQCGNGLMHESVYLGDSVRACIPPCMWHAVKTRAHTLDMHA